MTEVLLAELELVKRQRDEAYSKGKLDAISEVRKKAFKQRRDEWSKDTEYSIWDEDLTEIERDKSYPVPMIEVKDKKKYEPPVIIECDSVDMFDMYKTCEHMGMFNVCETLEKQI